MREVGQYRPRARRLLAHPHGAAHEHPAPARRVAAAGRLVGTADDQLADVGRRRDHVEPFEPRAVDPQVDGSWDLRGAAALASRAARADGGSIAFRLQVLPRGRDADGVEPGLHADTDLEWIGLGWLAVGLHTENPELEDVLGVDRKIVRDDDAGA